MMRSGPSESPSRSYARPLWASSGAPRLDPCPWPACTGRWSLETGDEAIGCMRTWNGSRDGMQLRELFSYFALSYTLPPLHWNKLIQRQPSSTSDRGECITTRTKNGITTVTIAPMIRAAHTRLPPRPRQEFYQ